MDIEQLKLVLETLQGLGHETSNLTVIWLSLKYGTMVLGWLLSVGVIVYVTTRIYRAVTSGTDEAFFGAMRDQLGTGRRGALTRDELHDTKRAIRTLVSEYVTRKEGEK